MKKGGGAFGVSVEDGIDVEGAGNPSACSGPPSNPSTCGEFVAKKDLKDHVSTSSAYGSASVKTITALGSLTASAKASEAGKGQQSSLADAVIASEDTFTITSTALPAGTPASFTASIQVSGPAIPCSTGGSSSLSIGTSHTGLSFDENCNSSPTPILSVRVDTTVGAQFTDEMYLELGVDAGGDYFPGKLSTGTLNVTYHLDPITSGASYVTASGESYL